MVTHQDLRDALADAADDPRAESLTRGLSDRALSEARDGLRWRWRWGWRLATAASPASRRLLPGAAIGSALVAAAIVGVAALGGGSGSGGAYQGSLTSPGSVNPLGRAALTEFGAECFDGHGPKLDLSYVWDPATRQYQGVSGDVTTSYQAAPDGSGRALVLRGLPQWAQAWGVAGWSDAVAGRVTMHPIPDEVGVQWTTDGKEVTSVVAWNVAKKDGGVVLKNRTADFYDPATGRLLAAVPIPQPVIAMAASGQWSVQQWQGDHDDVLFPLMDRAGTRMEFLNGQGTVVRTLTLQNGLAAGSQESGPAADRVAISPDGRYLAESVDGHLATFDLKAGGKRIGLLTHPQSYYQGWTADNEIVTADEDPSPSALGRGFAKTGHSPVYTVLTPELKVAQTVRFVLPADPRGRCATWPMTWAPKAQFPGAFVP